MIRIQHLHVRGCGSLLQIWIWIWILIVKGYRILNVILMGSVSVRNLNRGLDLVPSGLLILIRIQITPSHEIKVSIKKPK